MIKRIVTNKEFEDALNNMDNISIMNKVAASFRHIIDEDELYTCKLLALWEALLSWKQDGLKFTTFLWKKLRWECIKIAQQKQKHRQKFHHIIIDKPVNPYQSIEEHIEKLPYEMRDIVIKRYIDRMTLREISTIYGTCHETIRRKLKKSMEILKKGV